jgi:Tfp pilus assembly protein PilV
MKVETVQQNDTAQQSGQKGFTLLETSIALVVMMVVGLGAASLFFFALSSNSTARDRELSMAVAQQQMEQLRNASFSNLESTVSALGGSNRTAISGGRQYTVITTMANTIAGDSSQKTVTVEVSPAGSGALSGIERIFGGVTLVTIRTTSALGPNRGP